MDDDDPIDLQRRPIKSRGQAWARLSSQLCIRLGLRPNTISALSLIFAAVAGVLVFWSSRAPTITWTILALIAAAACVQLRLLCNLMDGMVAIEGGFRSVTGELWNDVPDRFADLAILVPVGYTISSHSWGVELGWAAGVGALITAYVRMLGGSCGLPQDFCGPMAKPQRMAIITITLIAMAIAPGEARDTFASIGLGLIAAGSLITAVRRLRRISVELRQA